MEYSVHSSTSAQPGEPSPSLTISRVLAVLWLWFLGGGIVAHSTSRSKQRCAVASKQSLAGYEVVEVQFVMIQNNANVFALRVLSQPFHLIKALRTPYSVLSVCMNSGGRGWM